MAVFINMDVGVKVRGWDAPPLFEIKIITQV
jgi:hypothetical protein